MSNKKHFGLTSLEVLKNRAKYGDNTLTPPAKASLWSKFLEKFDDPIIVILLIALALSVGVAIYQFTAGLEGGEIFLEPVGIFVAVLLATLIGFLFEVNADKKFEILNKVNDESPVKVMREGEIHLIPKCDVVVGDTILLEAGDEVPADARIVESISLQVNESTLTGEPVARKSCCEREYNPEATYPSNHIMRGTTVVEGHAVAVVVHVGDATEYGKVYRGAQIDSSVKTPLNKQLDKLATLITRVSYCIATLIIVGRLWVYLSSMVEFDLITFGGYLLNTIMIAVTLIVVSVPEGLPMSVTLSLALSMQRMLKANNLVRKMHACETMGATTVICTDKTGTLTENKMQVFEAQFVENIDKHIIYEALASNSTAHLERIDAAQPNIIGNPTEGALLLWLDGQGVDYRHLRDSCELVDQLPFSTERKYMASLSLSPRDGVRRLYIKGAPEVIISLSSAPGSGVGESLLRYQGAAMRTLAFGYIDLPEGEPITLSQEFIASVKFNFMGIVAISDPIRHEVPKAIANCHRAGIKVKIVTGDTSATAKEIGRQIGLWSAAESEQNHMSGVEFAALSDGALLERIASLKIISRARPMDKQRLVQLLQQCGEVVAVTGDGTNDAPALKAAQIGLSMGDGTSVAKEASDITILDNSFNTISRAVMWGRSLYQNIQRFILFQLTINVVACCIVLLGAFLGTESPLTVTQMLWVNLIMDTFAALALASLPPSEGVMRDKPRSAGEHIITRAMGRQILGVGLSFVVLLFALMQYFKSTDISSLAQFRIADALASMFDFTATGVVTPYEMSLFFTIFVMLQFWNMFNARAFLSGKSALRNIFDCGGFILTALIILGGQWLITTFAGTMFSVVPISAGDWVRITIATSLVLVVGELVRLVRNHFVAYY